MAEQKQITFTIDGQPVTAPAGTLVIEAAKTQGIEVPSFCYYPGLSLQAACRMCLVEVEKMPKLQTACTLVATDGMVVKTDTEQVHKARKDMIEFLLSNHPLDCPVCDKGGECELQDMTFRYGLDKTRFIEEKLHTPEEKWSPLVYYDAPRCILCFRCVRVCDEGMDVKALGVGARGVQSVILPNKPGELACEECGMCIDICPVGALTSGTYRYQTRPWEMTYVGNPCAHCSNGCKTTLSVRNNEILRANNRDHSGINGEFLCAKGRFGYDFTTNAERIRQPLVRRNGKLEPASWEDALEEVARRLKQVHATHGPAAIGVIGSNHTTNEENYLLNRFARVTLGTNNLDHHRTADYAGLAAALGPKAKDSLATMADVYNANAVLLIGNDVTQQNPLVAWQIRTGVRHHGLQLYVINGRPEQDSSPGARSPSKCRRAASARRSAGSRPRRASSTRRPPKSLVQLKAALEAEKRCRRYLRRGNSGRGDSRSGFAERAIRRQDEIHGAGRLREFARRCRHGRSARPPARLCAAFGFRRARAIRQTLGRRNFRRRPASRRAAMMEAAVAGKLKALYVVGANPVKTFGVAQPDRLAGLDLLVVHDLFLTETAQRADVVLPAASTYEKDGTLTNTAGEVQADAPRGRRAGPAQRFRSAAHSFAPARHARARHADQTAHARSCVRRNPPACRGLRSFAARACSAAARNLRRPACKVAEASYDVPAGAVFSSHDYLFTSGTLGRYCSRLTSTNEAKETPWSSSPSTQSWWYR